MPIPSPFAYDGFLYLNGGKNKALAAIKPGAGGDLTTPDGAKLNEYVAWLQPRGGTYLPTEVAYNGGCTCLLKREYSAASMPRAARQTTSARIGSGGDFTSSPWGYNGKIFCLSEEGKTFVDRRGREIRVAPFQRSGRNGSRDASADR